MSPLPHRPLGASGLEVSVFALGSWRTYERIPREAGVAVLQEARACGYSDPPPPPLPMQDVVAAVAELVSGGRVRAWGIVNWPAPRVAEAGRVARELGVAPPCAAQLP